MKILLQVDTLTGKVEKVGEYCNNINELGFITLPIIIKTLADKLNLTEDNIRTNITKQEPEILIRQILFYLIYEVYDYQNYNLIKKLFHYKQHDTISKGIENVKKYVHGHQKDTKYVNWYNRVLEIFNENEWLDKRLILS